jgi:hypothetical protein
MGRASRRPESARSSIVHALRGNRDLLCVPVHRRRVQATALFGRRIGQSFWTLGNGQAIHRQDVDDRVKNIDERTG